MIKPNYYKLCSSLEPGEFIDVENSLYEFQDNCKESIFNDVTSTPINIKTHINGYLIPDFLYESGIPLISDKFKSILDSYMIDYLFYKRVKFIDNRNSISYWMACPPRVNCLDLKRTKINSLGLAMNYPIIQHNYMIFKLGQVENLDIIVNETLMNSIKLARLYGIYFIKLKS